MFGCVCVCKLHTVNERVARFLFACDSSFTVRNFNILCVISNLLLQTSILQPISWRLGGINMSQLEFRLWYVLAVLSLLLLPPPPSLPLPELWWYMFWIWFKVAQYSRIAEIFLFVGQSERAREKNICVFVYACESFLSNFSLNFVLIHLSYYLVNLNFFPLSFAFKFLHTSWQCIIGRVIGAVCACGFVRGIF